MTKDSNLNQAQGSNPATANLAPETIAAQPFGAPVISEKKVTSSVIVSIICVVLAIAGCSFGVFELFQNLKQSQQIKDLQITVNNKEQEIATLRIRTDIATPSNNSTENLTNCSDNDSSDNDGSDDSSYALHDDSTNQTGVHD